MPTAAQYTGDSARYSFGHGISHSDINVGISSVAESPHTERYEIAVPSLFAVEPEKYAFVDFVIASFAQCFSYSFQFQS